MKNGGRIPWNALPSCGTFKISCLMGKTPYERRFGMPFNRPVMPFGAMVEYHPISANLVQKSCQVYSSVVYCMRQTRKQTTSRPDTLWPEIWKGMSDASKRKEKQTWLSRNQSSTMPDDHMVFVSLILEMRKTSVLRKTLVENWKFRCQQQCLVQLHCAEVTGKPAALLENTRQNTLVLLKLTKP